MPIRYRLLQRSRRQTLAELGGWVAVLGLLTPLLGALTLERQAVLLLIQPLSGLIAALRLRPSTGAWWRQLLDEGLSALLIWGMIGVGCLLTLRLWIGDSGFQLWPPPETVPSLLALSIGGIAYTIFRISVRSWLIWDRLRRRRLLWALTHAHLTVVASVALIFTVVVSLNAASREPVAWLDLPLDSPLGELSSRVLVNVLPILGIAVVGSLLSLLLVLPPAALVSLLVARRTTARVERLAAAAEALRHGDYASRVQTDGSDEIARLQHAFNAMADELGQTLSALQAERDRVAELLAARRRLFAAVSHELRTPVTTLRGYLEADLGRWDALSPADLHADFVVMERETARLHHLIDDLLILARHDAGGLPLDLQSVEIAALLQRIQQTASPLAWRNQRISLICEIDSRPLPAHADPARLEQCIVNLLRNALRHTPPGGIVALLGRSADQHIVIEVRDTGSGIAPSDLPKIWQPFYRGKGASRDGSGAGVGLAIVRELIEAMGGQVEVESQVGVGSCFRLRLAQRCDNIATTS